MTYSYDSIRARTQLMNGFRGTAVLAASPSCTRRSLRAQRLFEVILVRYYLYTCTQLVGKRVLFQLMPARAKIVN